MSFDPVAPHCLSSGMVATGPASRWCGRMAAEDGHWMEHINVGEQLLGQDASNGWVNMAKNKPGEH